MKGTVKFFNRTKGFGFVILEDRSAELFFHVRDCHADLLDLKHLDNFPVEFEIGEGPKGPQAIGVIPVIKVHQGHVKFFDKEKLFGFIRRPDGSEIYFKGAACSLSVPLEEDIWAPLTSADRPPDELMRSWPMTGGSVKFVDRGRFRCCSVRSGHTIPMVLRRR